MNFERMDTEPSTGKNYGFWLPWGTYKEYQTKYCYGSVKKNKCSFICHLDTDKKINNVIIKKIQGEKLVQTLIFGKLSSAYEILMRRNVI